MGTRALLISLEPCFYLVGDDFCAPLTAEWLNPYNKDHKIHWAQDSFSLGFWAHTWWCSGPTPGSVLQHHSWKDSADHIGCWGLNVPHAKQPVPVAPSLWLWVQHFHYLALYWKSMLSFTFMSKERVCSCHWACALTFLLKCPLAFSAVSFSVLLSMKAALMKM